MSDTFVYYELLFMRIVFLLKLLFQSCFVLELLVGVLMKGIGRLRGMGHVASQYCR